VKLLLLSLGAECPGVEVDLFYPPATDGFVAWMKRCPHVRLHTQRLDGSGFNVKPGALISLLESGFDEVVWVDSDVLIIRDALHTISKLRSDVLAATEHETTTWEVQRDRNALRAQMWGLPVGRVLPSALNSGVVRVTRHHLTLLTRWRSLLELPAYQESQKRWPRPAHMKGDQDVLTALLTSKEFAEVPVYMLRRGRDILQCDAVLGHTLAERVRTLLGRGPAFIHTGYSKPWKLDWPRGRSLSAGQYLKMVSVDLSPYSASATRFRHQLECDTRWMDPHYVLTRFLRALGMGRAGLTGLPMAVFVDLAQFVLRVGGRWSGEPIAIPEPQLR
jgi:hypothetical protein